jgi:Xaa-Pro aminopeptidase
MASIAKRALNAAGKLATLRGHMASAGLAAYVVPSSDAHNSEYIADRDARRAFISDFTGSAGTAVITHTDARLWTDGRYFLQANMQLDASAGWKLMRDREKETPSIEEWLAKSLAAGEVVGIDPYLFSVAAVRRMQAALDRAGIQLDTAARANPVDTVWGSEQPAQPCTPVVLHPLKYAGVTHSQKVADVQRALEKEGAVGLVVTALDELAWLFNIRGGDVECNPVTIAYAVVTTEEAVLCIDEAKLTPQVREHLGPGVRIAPYGAVLDVVRGLAARGRVWVDPATCNYAVYGAALAAATGTNKSGVAASTGSVTAGGSSGPASAPASSAVLEKPSPLTLAKALKNSAEIDGMRAAHVRDAVALVTFLSWLEAAVTRGVDLRSGPDAPLQGEDTPLTEFSAAAVLDRMRGQQAGFAGLSFPTIAGSGPNGAIIHYRPEAATAAAVTDKAVFLLDSGGQYCDGTTDVTRTVHFGSPSPHERECYTRVLQGHIGMARARFPAGASGVALDAMARAPLWAVGLDYRHGTGHGVGAYLNVHEGPQGAASAPRNAYDGGLQAGMTLTDEPGYYEDGAFGIRIENVLVVREAATPHRFGGKPYLEFEPLTVVPISTRLLDASLLSEAERAWLNDYNGWVRATLGPLLQGHAADYMRRETEPV